jgi:hypothetical protein
MAERGQLTVISSDRVDRGVGNLGSPVVRAEVECWLDGVELLILDNLSSLTVGVRENDSDAWGEIQDWLLRLRRRDISVLIIHHAGKILSCRSRINPRSVAAASAAAQTIPAFAGTGHSSQAFAQTAELLG